MIQFTLLAGAFAYLAALLEPGRTRPRDIAATACTVLAVLCAAAALLSAPWGELPWN